MIEVTLGRNGQGTVAGWESGAVSLSARACLLVRLLTCRIQIHLRFRGAWSCSVDAWHEVKDMGVCYGSLERLNVDPLCAGGPTGRAVCARRCNLGRPVEVKIRAVEILRAKPGRIHIDPAKRLPTKTGTLAHASDDTCSHTHTEAGHENFDVL